MERASYHWQEIIVNSQASSSNTSSGNGMVELLRIEVDWKDVTVARQQILGYAGVTGIGNERMLYRVTPAKHPYYPWLRAVECTVQGFNPKEPNEVPSINYNNNPPNVIGNWDKAKITIKFETPPHAPLLEDNTFTSEYQRYVIKVPEVSVESISKKGETFYFCNPVGAGAATFPGDFVVKTPKTHLRWIWKSVPSAWVMLGDLIPYNLQYCMGKVNLYPFPKTGFTDQNTGNPIQYPAGTLLMLPPKFTPGMQIIPTNSPNAISNYPRVYDIEINMLYFNPSTIDATMFRLIDPLTGFNTFVTDFIRGHNLVPGVRPNAASTSRYWAATRGNPVTTNPVLLPPNQLIYEYIDFEIAFQAVRSLGTLGK